MKSARIICVASALAIGFGVTAAHAAAPDAAFEQPVIVVAAADPVARKDISFDFRGILHSFARVEEANTTTVATADPAAEKCPTEKEKSETADSQNAKKADKSSPQGPEPIYFAF